MDACVYISTKTNEKLALMRGSDRPIPLAKCGASPLRQFTFFDQVHTTGHDIKQSLQARAAVTIGKDTTLRDYAQGCWRMRQLEEGQTLEVLVVEQVLALVHECTPPDTIAAGGDTGMLHAIMAFLLLNSCRSEHMQHSQLQVQNLCTIWRAEAVSLLRNASSPGVRPTDAVEDIASMPVSGRLVTRFQTTADDVAAMPLAARLMTRFQTLPPCHRAMEQLVDTLDFDIPAEPRSAVPFSKQLENMLKGHSKFIKGCAASVMEPLSRPSLTPCACVACAQIQARVQRRQGPGPRYRSSREAAT